MTKMSSLFVMLIIVISTIFVGCTKPQTTVQSDLVGTVKVEDSDSDTIVTYTFKNESKKDVTVIGGARYELVKDNKVVEEGGVPIKDYLTLEQGQEYTDKKTFSNLKSGSYRIDVEWNNTIVTAKFSKDT
ncbi:hypothetical protein [Paenibacillus sp. GCM10028914]|uniref:hypothetical protein n=1 Tax=Paenibacillus sp. GCM10028914 TaxID=3273416 RepID=UPI0036D28698